MKPKSTQQQKKNSPRTAPRREDGQETRTRIIHAAGEVFAQEGFRASSVRVICQRAGANLGSIRYYFGTKEALYRETIFGAYHDLTERGSIKDEDYSGPASLALLKFIRLFMVALLERRRNFPYLPTLMMRELAQPTSVFNDLVRELFLPLRQQLATIVRREMGPGANSARVEENTNRILLLCIQFALCRPILERFPGVIPKTRPQIEALAESVHAFALHGLHEHTGHAHAPALTPSRRSVSVSCDR
ncbi:TetR/AcrR family transcriptional regulator [Ruficoccus amylovorans]|uniref:TetR/AcrR family transcriptional regulator n=1 Tax=Ruficoccus amylovorans TaxID=1804625 RepID=A0A842HFV2_9BACT|nr:TetR/AcrR family transcriptional regulator [Ruficoccus amylovorans]MBC2595403.1 TetR/AcrR family transcriptional regulator [Ruficoccus amylovorans]